uniref:Bullous pemphigoid antigen 1, isoforms 1/2/3/4 n=1 Tax=Lepeophtheirus salmonis TaxID=72036 RepID=C1BSY1_LEPSM|nr:Bullous pemphigoid antigen 1, isoforms 1/2/3/4 [Lepeophtheirus salmonis]
MAHTTSIYYRDRLGFEPDYEGNPEEASRLAGKYNPGSNTSSLRRGSSSRRSNNNSTKVETEDPSHGVYEENLTKFKDERDAIQKKTFTKWVNKHLKKVREMKCLQFSQSKYVYTRMNDITSIHSKSCFCSFFSIYLSWFNGSGLYIMH